MEISNSEEIRLLVDDMEYASSSSSSICLCRICHEEEEQSSTSMESPCACSGTLKFAHRRCIQRWCDEKGNTICEICHEKFEPGYTVTPPIEMPHVIDVVFTIRGSLEAARHYEPQFAVTSDQQDPEQTECSPASRHGRSCFQLVALTFTVMLLMRHVVAQLTVGTDLYASTLPIVFLLRAIGILLPSYLILRLIIAVLDARYQQFHDISSVAADDLEEQQHAL